MQKQKCGFTPALLLFLVLSQQIGWQGYGNVNRTVVDTVMGYISANVSSHTGDSSYDAFNTAFSDELNRRWEQAWNVFTIVTTSTDDTILYGYAFRNQWMWYNDYRVNGVVLAFVIWKDYNCHTWQTVGKNGGASGFADVSFIQTTILTSNTMEKNNMWMAAKAISDRFNPDGPFSIVVSTDSASDMYGRICVVQRNFFYNRIDAGGQPFQQSSTGTWWGNLLVFQTRLLSQ